jgi:hypothetical protein
MRYQLVLQFRGDSIDDLDELIDLEDRLIARLGDEHLVDGHDIGSGERNIFIHSDDPHAAFAAARSVIPTKLLSRLRAAFRPRAGGKYSVIWPLGAGGPFEVN